MDNSISQKNINTGARSPCPYCQSWMNTAPNDADKNRLQKTSTVSQGTIKKSRKGEVTRKQNIEALTTGSNPYAPHLKYGIFPQNNPSVNRKYNSADRPKSPMKQRFAQIQKEDDQLMKKDLKCDSPFFSVRPLGDQDRGNFAVSQSTQLDLELGNRRLPDFDALKRYHA